MASGDFVGNPITVDSLKVATRLMRFNQFENLHRMAEELDSAPEKGVRIVNAACDIQRVFRGWASVKKSWRFSEVSHATRKLQGVVRGHRVRRIKMMPHFYRKFHQTLRLTEDAQNKQHKRFLCWLMIAALLAAMFLGYLAKTHIRLVETHVVVRSTEAARDAIQRQHATATALLAQTTAQLEETQTILRSETHSRYAMQSQIEHLTVLNDTSHGALVEAGDEIARLELLIEAASATIFSVEMALESCTVDHSDATKQLENELYFTAMVRDRYQKTMDHARVVEKGCGKGCQRRIFEIEMHHIQNLLEPPSKSKDVQHRSTK
jgi:hypothetical protein